MTTARRWTAVSGFDLHWCSWGDESIVYNDGSGDTHLLSPVDAEALKSLQQAPANIPELAERIASALNIEADDEFFFYLETLLTQLEKLGLIERIRP